MEWHKKIISSALVLFLFLTPRFSSASEIEGLREDYSGLKSQEKILVRELKKLQDRAQSLSGKIGELQTDEAGLGLVKMTQMEGFLKKSKEIEAELAETSVRLNLVRERMGEIRGDLIAALSEKIESAEKNYRKDRDQEALGGILELRREKERLLDELFQEISPRIVMPALAPDDSPGEIEAKIEVLDLARDHLRKQLEMTESRLRELRRQAALSRGLQEFLDDTHEFSREVSRREEVLAQARVSPEAGGNEDPVPGFEEDDRLPGDEGVMIFDLGGLDSGQDLNAGECSICEQTQPSGIYHLESSSSEFRPRADYSASQSLEERMEQLSARKVTIEQLIQRVDERQRRLEGARS